MTQRVGDGARALGDLGDDFINRPGVLPGKAHGWFRTWFGKVWRVRGGGLYALGYALTFVYLEVTTVLGELAAAESVSQFLTSEIVEFVFRFLSDSIINLVRSLIWPIHFLQMAPPWGAIGLGLAFVIFPMLLKKPIERWLFGQDTAE